MNDPNGEVSDSQSEEEGIIEGGYVPELEDLKFHGEKHHAETAKKLAFLLVWVLAISILIHYGTTAYLEANGGQDAAKSLAGIFNVWLPMISGLVSAAATYYFTKER